ncbi:MAG: aspartate 1-decarboxylase [Bacteroidia bacterium]|nr:aspartate 1-decarboxylase [Bacteroidia bacterium]MCX7763428.1 aspartate 1-decarboxylase [Bacteroidia bacterium]MDW8057593.1 aspartate 1-decarboxylase [Bacteroidia bacterium]
MWVCVLRSKIHRARITQVDLDYVGSLTLDKELMEAAGLLPFERVHVLNVNTGSRIETYVIEGEAGSGVVGLNGPAARTGLVGDIVIILSYAWMPEEEARTFRPRIVFPKEGNRL